MAELARSPGLQTLSLPLDRKLLKTLERQNFKIYHDVSDSFGQYRYFFFPETLYFPL